MTREIFKKNTKLKVKDRLISPVMFVTFEVKSITKKFIHTKMKKNQEDSACGGEYRFIPDDVLGWFVDRV